MSTTLLGAVLLSVFFIAIYLLCSKLPETKTGQAIHEEMLRKQKGRMSDIIRK